MHRTSVWSLITVVLAPAMLGGCTGGGASGSSSGTGASGSSSSGAASSGGASTSSSSSSSGTPAPVVELNAQDALTTHALGQGAVEVELAGRGGMPSTATAAWLQFDFCVSLSDQTGVTVHSAAAAVDRTLKTPLGCGTSFMWMPLDGTQRITLEAGKAIDVKVTVLGWVEGDSSNLNLNDPGQTAMFVADATTVVDVDLAGRGGLPANAQAVYVQLAICADLSNATTLSITTDVLTTPRTVHTPLGCGSTFLWLPVGSAPRATLSVPAGNTLNVTVSVLGFQTGPVHLDLPAAEGTVLTFTAADTQVLDASTLQGVGADTAYVLVDVIIRTNAGGTLSISSPAVRAPRVIPAPYGWMTYELWVPVDATRRLTLASTREMTVTATVVGTSTAPTP